MEKGTLVLTRSDIQNALSLAEYLPVIEEAHALHAQGKVYAPDLLHADVRNGEFHLKTGGICYGDEEYYGVKISYKVINWSSISLSVSLSKPFLDCRKGTEAFREIWKITVYLAFWGLSIYAMPGTEVL